MPFDLDIEVEALALEDHEIDRLRADTAYVVHTNTHPTPVIKLV